MEIETKIISTEMIKPSSPTPKSLQKHHLSFLDQLMPQTLSPIIYFYSSDYPKIPNSEKSKQLKKSLSETLSIYYPLAGNLHVDCNDAGAAFSEAEADGDISLALTNSDANNLKKFLPYDEAKDICMAAQATYFRCGGIAVAILISHKLADALSFMAFANAWSAIARNGGAGGLPKPSFAAATYFPPIAVTGFDPATRMAKEVVERKIFGFSAAKIAALRQKYSAGGGRRGSRVEAVSAFIWSVFMSATGMRSDPDKIRCVRNAVNIRTRADPPLSEYHFGNFVITSNAKATSGDGDVEILRKMREAGKAVNGKYVNWLKKGENFMKEMTDRGSEESCFSFCFSSLCRLPLYDADFGWGKPVWVGLGGSPYRNVAVFKDTKSGDGIEALIHLSKKDMEKFKAHFELQMLKSNL